MDASLRENKSTLASLPKSYFIPLVICFIIPAVISLIGLISATSGEYEHDLPVGIVFGVIALIPGIRLPFSWKKRIKNNEIREKAQQFINDNETKQSNKKSQPREVAKKLLSENKKLRGIYEST